LPRSNLRRLRAALEHYFGAQARDRVRSIVDIGCGRCDELGLLLELFPRAVLALVDSDPASIHYLERENTGIGARVRLRLADARELDRFAPGPFDLAIIRHPDLDARPGVWDTVIRVTVDQVADGGTLLVSSYSVGEAEAVRRIARAQRLTDVTNQHLIGMPVALNGGDRYILVYIKQ
jgi:SAM-dependent methyltransferase